MKLPKGYEVLIESDWNLKEKYALGDWIDLKY